jgi:hypothetical protein
MNTIEFFTIIERPKETVQLAVLEGLKSHKASGKIPSIIHLESEYSHLVELDPGYWPKSFTDISIGIEIIGSEVHKNHTILEGEITYSNSHKNLVFKTINNIIFRFRVKRTKTIILNQFKYRVEKWL